MEVDTPFTLPFIVRIVSIDYYMARPAPKVDFSYAPLEGTAIDQVPVVRIFGSTPSGQKACVHLHKVRRRTRSLQCSSRAANIMHKQKHHLCCRPSHTSMCLMMMVSQMSLQKVTCLSLCKCVMRELHVIHGVHAVLT